MCNVTAVYIYLYATALLIMAEPVQLWEECYSKWCQLVFLHPLFIEISHFHIEINRS